MNVGYEDVAPWGSEVDAYGTEVREGGHLIILVRCCNGNDVPGWVRSGIDREDLIQLGRGISHQVSKHPFILQLFLLQSAVDCFDSTAPLLRL